MKLSENTFRAENGALHYLEAGEGAPMLLIHAQGVDATSFDNVMKPLAKKYHVYSVDCFGHGKSAHDPENYNVRAIGDAVAQFIREGIGRSTTLVGHSSGGLIAAYAASACEMCDRLFLEDPPLFSSQGERRFQTFNYVDLSTLCHEFLAQSEETDFVLYYFAHQLAWELFPPETKAKIYDKMVSMARKDRAKHPGGNLKVPLWPKYALAGFRGMSDYDPRFGVTFYDDSFHAGIPHEALLKKLRCKTIIMKAKTHVGEDGLLYAAMNDEDAARAKRLIPGSRIANFDCGHGLHFEKEQQFVDLLLS